MGILTNRVERSELKPGDHIYTYRVVFAYSHHAFLVFQSFKTWLDLHFRRSWIRNRPISVSIWRSGKIGGIFVGGSKVVHFRPKQNLINPTTETTSDLYDSTSTTAPSSCPTFPDCGFRQPNSGVVLSCIDCFLRTGSLYCFEYGVSPSVFLSRLRGGTCTTAPSDPPETVIHRAMYLLQNGFGNYDVFQNNCEDFTLYCKTGLLTMDSLGLGRSGQASSVIGAPLAALISSPLKLLMPNPVGVAVVTAGMYGMSRYATDIGVRTDIVKVAVEDLAVNLGWEGGVEEEVVVTNVKPR